MYSRQTKDFYENLNLTTQILSIYKRIRLATLEFMYIQSSTIVKLTQIGMADI